MKTPNVLANASASLNVDLSAIIGNYQTLSSQSSSADCAAVVKANAYGLGMEQVASAIYNNTDCKIFFVANLLEAISLRKILPEAIIYVFNGLFEDQIDTYTEYNIRPILNNIDQIALWDGRTEPCAIHFDTGINRLGLNELDTENFLSGANDLNLTLILSHLVRSEEPDHPTNKIQLEKFNKIRSALPHIPASLANSGGIYLGDEYHFDLLRPGIMLYGGNPGLKKLSDGIKNT
ncbi:MAG: alanine racemase, partial [Kordiimonadaceae bacterium]|nr:alanine racemase [Kordiimonadaceae bacterium]